MSVPLVGWSLAQALREVADVHLVTQIRNRAAILRAGLIEGRDFTAVDSEAVARRAHRVAETLRMGSGRGWTMVTALQSLAYPWFERLVWKQFGNAIENGEYDLVHRVTPLTPTAVSPMARRVARAGVPFVLGPLNGGVPWPAEFRDARKREREWLSYLRSAYRAMPGRRAMYNATAAVLAGSRHTASELPKHVSDRVIWFPENGINPERFPPPGPKGIATGPIPTIFIGRLVPYKGPDMAIEAAAPFIRDGRITLDILGDGPMREDLQAIAEREGVGDGVRIHGMVPHEELHRMAARARLMIFPSIREFGGGVVLEAMAMGVVPLVVDYAGPGELVDAQTGFKVPMGRRSEIVKNIRTHLSAVVADPSALDEIARAGRARIEERYTWPEKARHMREVYDWVLGRRDDRPSFE
ncbi:MAG: glycosyltransferase [Pseudomonadota bacterium]